jgi:rhamnose utilization protein RhaD (predicted bifunctional aldolase and dehydrogenase)
LSEASEICKQRLFPDEVVCCGPESAFVPYADPGLPLAKAIRSSVEAYVQAWGAVPKTIWLQNHGLIALGRSRAEIESASLMAAKAAEVWLGALSTKRKLCPMTSAQVERIHYRPDEHYRQKLLWQIQHESKI